MAYNFVFNPLTGRMDITDVNLSPPGDIEFLEGNTGGSVAPDAGHIVNIIGSGAVTVDGDPLTSTLTISITDGNLLETITGDSGGAVGVDGTNNINYLGNTGLYKNGIQFTGDPLTNTITAKDLRNITKYVVDPVAGETEYTTIQSALDAANAAGGNATVYARPGTYAEDLTLYDSVDIEGTNEQATIIVGVHTPPASGNLNLFRCTFQSATHVLNSAVAGTTSIIMEDCTVACTNGYTFNLPNWTGFIGVFDIGPSGTNDGFVNNTAGATFFSFSGGIGNGTGNSMILSGTTLLKTTQVGCPVSFQSTGTANIVNSLASATLTTADTSTVSIFNSSISTGANSVISHGSANALALSNVTIDTSNMIAIDGAGAGTVNLGNVTFLNQHTLASTLNVNIDLTVDTTYQGWIGAIVESAIVSVTSDGATITFSVERNGGGDLSVITSKGYYEWDTTPADTISLTAGSDSSPQINYVYWLESTRALTASTVGWPSTEHAPLATVLCQSAASLQTEGAYKVHAWTDHVVKATDNGHIAHLNFWIRQQNATWVSGVNQTYTITPGATDSVTIETVAGVVLQLHDHDFPAFSNPINYYVVNDPVTPYDIVTDLNALLTDSNGVSMSGRYFSLVLWGCVSEDASDCKLFINLPSGSYTNATSLAEDANRYADFSIPSEFKGTGFLISQWNLRNVGGTTWTSIEEIDLRGLIPSTVAGGGGAAATEFPDNTFRIFDEGDNTKKIAFQASALTTANTRTITMIDADIDLANVVQAASAITDNIIVRGDGGVRGVQNSGVTIDDSGNISELTSLDGAALSMQLYNTSNTGAASTYYDARVTTASTGDPYFSLAVAGANHYAFGLDNSDSDKLKLTRSNANVTPSTGSEILTIDSINTATFAVTTLENTKSVVGADTSIKITNTDNTDGGSNAVLDIVTGGASGGDAYLHLDTGVTEYSWGIDNSSTTDLLVLTNGASPSAGTEFIKVGNNGVKDFIAFFDGDGPAAIGNSTVRISDETIGGSVGVLVQNTDNTDTSSDAGINLMVGGASSGDPYISLSNAGGVYNVIGVDNSDSDKLKIDVSGSRPGQGTNVWTMTTAGERTMPKQPAFLATHSVAQDNVTGSGANATVNFTTEVFDQNADYDGTNTFQAPVSGRYQISFGIAIFGLTAAMTNGYAGISASNRILSSHYKSWGVIMTSSNTAAITQSCLVDMDAGDTVTVFIQINNGVGNPADLSADVEDTWFSGHLVC